jgi:hypothetical protein
MRTAIIYAYFETPQTKFNLNFYSKIGISNSETEFYVIVVNGHSCSVDLPPLSNLVVLERDDIGGDFGADFGAHNCALEWLNKNKEPFDYYIFLNSSVIGPFLPPYYPKSLHWSDIFTSRITDQIKLVGTTISCISMTNLKNSGPKVGGHFFATDGVGLDVLYNSQIIFKDHLSKMDTIQAEYNLTSLIMGNGYSIDCLLYQYENVDWTDKNIYKLHSGNVTTDTTIHPFEVVFHKWYWNSYSNKLVSYDYCKKYVDWKLGLESSVERALIVGETPYLPVALYERRDIINRPNFNLKYNSGTGLCNQLFGLVTGILRCQMANKRYIVIDSFACCFIQQNICPIGQIINLEETAKNINRISGFEEIKLFDRNSFDLKITKAIYGDENVRVIDVAQRLQNLSSSDVSDNVIMNNFFGADPCGGIKKYLRVEYSLNGYEVEHIFEEDCKKFLHSLNKNFILENMFENKRGDFSWYNAINENLFVSILQKIRFTDDFYRILDIFGNTYDLSNVVVVHFRMEPDAINFWSRPNKMEPKVFEQKLCEKYNDLISKYVDKTDRIYILSHDESYIINKFNNIQTFIETDPNMKNELLSKYIGVTGRELSGIVDLLIGINNPKMFIGCHSFKNQRGSTFSYAIAMNTHCKKILLDLDNISNAEEVYGGSLF